ncbi:hypothetical protein [Limosilactobacillus fermentum]
MKKVRKKISEQTQKFVDDNPDFKKTKTQKRTNYSALNLKNAFSGRFFKL